MTALGRWRSTRRDQRRWIAEALITAALRERPDMGGYDLWKRTGLSSGRLHVALHRMEQAGRVAGRWVDGPYPRRRVYRLTDGDPL